MIRIRVNIKLAQARLLARSRTGDIYPVHIPIEQEGTRLTIDGGSSAASHQHRTIDRAINRCRNLCALDGCVNRHTFAIRLHLDRIGLSQQFRAVEASGFVSEDKTLCQEGEEVVCSRRNR